MHIMFLSTASLKADNRQASTSTHPRSLLCPVLKALVLSPACPAALKCTKSHLYVHTFKGKRRNASFIQHQSTPSLVKAVKSLLPKRQCVTISSHADTKQNCCPTECLQKTQNTYLHVVHGLQHCKHKNNKLRGEEKRAQ